MAEILEIQSIRTDKGWHITDGCRYMNIEYGIEISIYRGKILTEIRSENASAREIVEYATSGLFSQFWPLRSRLSLHRR